MSDTPRTDAAISSLPSEGLTKQSKLEAIQLALVIVTRLVGELERDLARVTAENERAKSVMRELGEANANLEDERNKWQDRATKAEADNNHTRGVLKAMERDLRDQIAVLKAERDWLLSHCRAIGMVKPSLSGAWNHDIALFTVDLKDRAEKAEADIRYMVGKAADNSLDGYRELGERAAAAENRADDLKTDLARLTAENEALRKDKEMMDWLERQVVTVRYPLRYGSREGFSASPDLEEETSNLRSEIDAALKEGS